MQEETFCLKKMPLQTLIVTSSGLSLEANFTYVYESPVGVGGDPQYSGNLIFSYDDSQTTAQLGGYYAWYNKFNTSDDMGNENGTFTWDFTLTRKLEFNNSLSTDVFLNIHNIFSESQYLMELLPNAPRWIEAGMRLRF